MNLKVILKSNIGHELEMRKPEVFEQVRKVERNIKEKDFIYKDRCFVFYTLTSDTQQGHVKLFPLHL